MQGVTTRVEALHRTCLARPQPLLSFWDPWALVLLIACANGKPACGARWNASQKFMYVGGGGAVHLEPRGEASAQAIPWLRPAAGHIASALGLPSGGAYRRDSNAHHCGAAQSICIHRRSTLLRRPFYGN